MSKPYTSPELVTYGGLTQVTGVSGVNGSDDVFLNDSGEDISDDFGDSARGSTDGCATGDFEDCL